MTIERRVRIIQDTDPQNPRDWDDVAKLICWHNRYNLGDDHDYNREDFIRSLASEVSPAFDEFAEYLDRDLDEDCDDLIDRAAEVVVRNEYVVLPIFMYDHSGIALSTGPFSCPWDSGQVGYVIIDRETIDKEWNGDFDCADQYARHAVEVYNQFIGGDVWGFIAEQRNDEGWEETESCWGFFGSDVETNGMKDHLSNDYADAMADAVTEYA